MAGVVTGWMNKGIGLFQFLQGRKLAKEAGDRPVYRVPREIEANLSMAQRRALEGLPEEQKQQYVDNLMQMQGAGLAQLSSRKAGLVGAGSIAQSATQGYRNLLAMDAQARLQGEQMLMGARENMAGYRDLAWKTNVMDPWSEQTAYAAALQGAGIESSRMGMAQDETAFREVTRSIIPQVSSDAGAGSANMNYSPNQTSTPNQDNWTAADTEAFGYNPWGAGSLGS